MNVEQAHSLVSNNFSILRPSPFVRQPILCRVRGLPIPIEHIDCRSFQRALQLPAEIHRQPSTRVAFLLFHLPALRSAEVVSVSLCVFRFGICEIGAINDMQIVRVHIFFVGREKPKRRIWEFE